MKRAGFRNCLERKKKDDYCSGSTFPLTALDGDSSLMPMHDVGTDPEAQTRPTNPFSRKEGFVHLALHLRGHAGACIGQREHQTFPARSPVCALPAANDKAASVRHGIDSVCNDIAQNLTNITLKTLNRDTRALAFFDGYASVLESRLVDAQGD